MTTTSSVEQAAKKAKQKTKPEAAPVRTQPKHAPGYADRKARGLVTR
jgi:hypothetical protein